MITLYPPQYVGISGSGISTDSIWDAVGDLVVGTGANAASALTKGTENDVLITGSTTLEWTDSIVIDGGSA
jgi:hypothetical protein